MHPVFIAGLLTTAAGLLLAIKGEKNETAKPDKNPDILHGKENSGKPAPVHPEKTAPDETISVHSSGRTLDPDSMGNSDTAAPDSIDTTGGE